MFERANEPQPVGGILDSGFKLFKASAKRVIPITYLGALSGAIWGWILQTTMLANLAETGQLSFDVPVVITAYILMIVIGTILMATAIIRIDTVYLGEELSFGNALLAGSKRAPAVFGASLIYMLAILGGSILLLIPGIFLSVSLAFAFYAAAADKKGPMVSIKYSYGLVKGNWWRTAGLLTIIFIIAFVFYIAVGFVVGILAVAGDPESSLQPSILADVIIVPIVTCVISAMLYCLGYAVYQDLRLRKEGSDLAERIESLEQA